MLPVHAIPPHDVAVLVQRYLQQGGFKDSRAAFEREAAALLERSLPPEPGQSIKSLPAVLNEYAALLARAEHRARFERSFGDAPAVRTCLSKLGELLDDYVRLRNGMAAPADDGAGTSAARGDAWRIERSSEMSAGPGERSTVLGSSAPESATAPATRPGGGARAAVGRPPAAVGRPPAGVGRPAEGSRGSARALPDPALGSRKRKAAAPRRRLEVRGTMTVTHSGQRSRELFGNLLADRITSAREPECGHSCHSPALPPSDRTARDRDEGEGGTAAMAIDDIVRSLLDDPTTFSVLSARPDPNHGGSDGWGGGVQGGSSTVHSPRMGATARSPAAAARGAARSPSTRSGGALKGQVGGGGVNGIEAPAADGGAELPRLPADLDVDTFLRRVHQGGEQKERR